MLMSETFVYVDNKLCCRFWKFVRASGTGLLDASFDIMYWFDVPYTAAMLVYQEDCSFSSPA
jgi:hypothetical protein